jgi:hypothetical protein
MLDCSTILAANAKSNVEDCWDYPNIVDPILQAFVEKVKIRMGTTFQLKLKQVALNS